jgi:hypothetical protein
MLMAVKDFLAPTRGRIFLFVIIFIGVFLYDTAFAPFPGSPVVENITTQDGATSFLLYILVLPYILSCLIPAFFGLRKRRFFRLSSLNEFMHPRQEHHSVKATRQQTFSFPAGTPVVESTLASSQPVRGSNDPLDTIEDLAGPSPKPAAKKASPRTKTSRKPSKRKAPAKVAKRPVKKK